MEKATGAGDDMAQNLKKEEETMKKLLLLTFVMVMSGALALGFWGWPQRAEAAPNEILVGVCTGLTGPFAGFGEGGVFGIKVYLYSF